MDSSKCTPIDEISQIRATLGNTFSQGLMLPLPARRTQLYQLVRMVQENADAIAESLLKDLGKPKMETYFAEIAALVSRSLISAEKIEEWAKPNLPEVPDRQKAFTPTVHKSPKGVVLIIAPWNYPVILSLQPLIGAIAAGCCAVVKPSEMVPTYAHLLHDLVAKYLDSSAYRVVNGAVAETTELLRLQWDHIVFTGNSTVGRIVATAAIRYLTPVTLELGGKSPVIIDPTYDISLAAKRILWGKCQNAGQICVSPDYVLIPRDKQEEFVSEIHKHHAAFFPEGALKSASYGHIINDAHKKRLMSVLERTKGSIAFGGKVDDKNGFEPTVVQDVLGSDSLMEEEIFGPILPIVPVDSVSDAIKFVNARDHPLVLYAFSESPDVKARIRDNTRSGSLVFNDTFQQMDVAELPFGGVGESGYGYQVLKATYDGFTHLRSSIDVPREVEQLLSARYPPYTKEHFDIMAADAFIHIHEEANPSVLSVPKS